MENKEGSPEKESCCGSSGSCGCGKRSCCGGKAALVLVLLLIGGLIGYGAGRCHHGMAYCPVSMGAPMTPPVK